MARVVLVARRRKDDLIQYEVEEHYFDFNFVLAQSSLRLFEWLYNHKMHIDGI